MAIVVEEGQKKSSGIVSFLMWLLIIGVVVAAAYYIFFKRPELVPVAVPASFQNTAALSKIKLNPDAVVNNPSFQALKSYIGTLTPPTGGRANPFLGF
jgi:hypothetical protein